MRVEVSPQADHHQRSYLTSPVGNSAGDSGAGRISAWLSGRRSTQRSYECLTFSLIRAGSEDLLELVHYDNQPPALLTAGASSGGISRAAAIPVRIGNLGSQLTAALGLREQCLGEAGSFSAS